MKEFDLTFSLNLYDKDGDSYEDCINVHLGNGVILQFKDLYVYDAFIDSLQEMRQEIKENL